MQRSEEDRHGSLSLGPAVRLSPDEWESLEELSMCGWTVGVIRAFAGAPPVAIARRGRLEILVSAQPIGRRR